MPTKTTGRNTNKGRVNTHTQGVVHMHAYLDNKRIENVISSYDHTEKTLIGGSDEHLDLILEITTDLSKITSVTDELINDIEKNFNSFTSETAKDAIVKIFPIFRLAHQLNNSLKRKGLTNGLETPIADFNAVVNELKEFVSDLERYKIQNTDDLKALFNEENI